MSLRSWKWKIVAAFLALCLTAETASAKVLGIPFFSQLDPRWKSGTICATVSMAMALAYRGANVDPAKLITWLKANKGYSSDGLNGPVNWKIACTYQGKQWLNFVGESKLPQLPQLKQDIDNGKIYISMSNRFHPHWVIIRGVSDDGKTGYYWDPLDTVPTTRTIGDKWVKPGLTCEVFSIP